MVYLLVVYVHVLATVFLVGYSLYWTILSAARPPGAEDPLPGRVIRSLWPPPGLPSPLRVQLPGLAWGALTVLILSGCASLLLKGTPLDQAFSGSATAWARSVKLLLVACLAAAQLVFAADPRPRMAYAAMFLVLCIVTISAVIVR